MSPPFRGILAIIVGVMLLSTFSLPAWSRSRLGPGSCGSESETPTDHWAWVRLAASGNGTVICDHCDTGCGCDKFRSGYQPMTCKARPAKGWVLSGWVLDDQPRKCGHTLMLFDSAEHQSLTAVFKRLPGQTPSGSLAD